ncbi:MAG: manganese efflux pump MntP family protein [Ignavibacteriaceae bacterium]
MSLLEILFLAVALALDAFAVSVASSSSGRITDKRASFRLSFHFGLFQALMPILGWSIGSSVSRIVEQFDHWIAFTLLLLVGVKMIHESFKVEDSQKDFNPSKGWALIILSIATSIDALVVGFSLAFLNTEIIYPSILIGIVTAVLSLLGINLGKSFGNRFGKKMEITGGLIIIAIGLKILISHITQS